MECMYSYINLSIPTRNFYENILLIKVDKKTFNNPSKLCSLSDDINEKHPEIDGVNIFIVFAVNDSLQPYGYAGYPEAAERMHNKKISHERFDWSIEFPDTTDEPIKSLSL